MAWRNRCYSLIAVGVLAVACAANPSPLTEAALRLESVGAYRVEYDLTTYLDETDKPVLATGQIDFEGLGRWHLRQGTLEMIGSGSTTYVRGHRGWRVEEMVELPIHPLLYLKAAVNVRRTTDAGVPESYSFSLDRERYSLALGQAIKAIGPALARVVARFGGEGEITLDDNGLPGRMRLHLRDSSMGMGKTRQDLEIRFLEFGGSYDIPAPEDAWAVAWRGGDR